MTKKILIINGPNLNMLGRREPGIYGSSSFDDYLPQLRRRFPDTEIDYYQSNIEGCLIDRIRSLQCPVIEVHISNVHRREEFRHHSMISCACLGVICGFGLDSYKLAVEALKNPPQP